LKALEAKIIHWRFKGKKDVKDIIDGIVRDVVFRMPGAAIIETVKWPNFLSAADSRKERERSDGTKTFAGCILMPDGDHETWTYTSKAAKAIHDSTLKKIEAETIFVYIYQLSENESYFKQTLNLLKRLLNKKGIYEE
jgi:hypothetical protein